MELKIFKIRNSEGLFSTGGLAPSWTKKGKTWNGIGPVKNHLRQFCSEFDSIIENPATPYIKTHRRGWWNKIPEDWVVVEAHFTNHGSSVVEYSANSLYPATTGEAKKKLPKFRTPEEIGKDSIKELKEEILKALSFLSEEEIFKFKRMYSSTNLKLELPLVLEGIGEYCLPMALNQCLNTLKNDRR